MTDSERPENPAPDLGEREPDPAYHDAGLDEAPAADVPQDDRDPKNDAVPE